MNVSGNTIVGNMGIGTFDQSGGMHTTTGTLTVSNTPGMSSGTYNLSGGTLTVLGGIVNNDKFNHSGGNLNANIIKNANSKLSESGTREVNGNVTNNSAALLEVYLTQANFYGVVINYGTVKVTPSIVNWLGEYDEYGNYNSDPSTNYFSNLIIETTGYLTGGNGDVFYISGNFINNSQNPLWNTENADLSFTGSGQHIYQLSSLGQANTWDVLSLLNGAVLGLTGDAGAGLYVENIVGGFSNIVNTGSNTLILYYNGQEFPIPPGGSPVPLPSTLLLLGSGLLGSAS